MWLSLSGLDFRTILFFEVLALEVLGIVRSRYFQRVTRQVPDNKMKFSSMLLVHYFCIFFLTCVTARRREGGRSRIPLIAERDEERSLLGGCTFGGEFFDLEETWHPYLGGTELVCHLCECVPVVEDGIVTGRVQCPNIRDTCKDPECDNPVRREGDCCKTCPTQPERSGGSEGSLHVSDPQHPSDAGRYLDEGDVSDHGQSWAALLTQRLVGSDSLGVARMSFQLIEDSLYFTLTYARIKRPSAIIFMDVMNETIYSHVVVDHKTDKICGVWTNLRGDHLQKLQTNQMFVTVLSKPRPEGDVKGRIVSHRAFALESFSTIMIAARRNKPETSSLLGNGGIVSMTVSPDGSGIELIALLDGLIERRAARGRDVNVTLELRKKSELLYTLTTAIDGESRLFVAALRKLPRSVRKWFARGQIFIKISVSGEPGHLSGLITPFATCNTFHAVLSGSEALGRPKALGATGSAILTIGPDGIIGYKVLVSGLRNRKVRAITLEASTRNSHRRKIIADILDGYDGNGLAQGVYSKPKPKDIQLILHGRVYVNIATNQHIESEVRGQVKQLPYNPVIDRETELPIQLSGASFSPPIATGAAGHAWMAYDQDCRLHYEIAVSGLDNEETRAYARMGYYNAGSAQVSLALDAFHGDMSSGVVDDLDESFADRIHEGVAFVQISTKAHTTGEIRGQVLIPSQCQPTTGDGGSPITRNLEHDVTACHFEGLFRASGSQWQPNFDPLCTTCHCNNGATICDPVMCPEVTCEDATILPGECCLTCPKDISEADELCYSEGDDISHRVGDTWHPYFPLMGGYMPCAVCECKPGAITTCSRVTCPEVTCANPRRASPGDCCKTCPEPEPTTPPTEELGIQADEVERGCTVNGQFHFHGDKWHPYIIPLGIESCIACDCDNGSTSCTAIVCQDLSSCSKKIKRKGRCCEICADEPLGMGSSDSSVSSARDSLPSIEEERRKPKS